MSARTPGPWMAKYDDYGDEIWFGGSGCGCWTVGPAFLGGAGPSKEGLDGMEADALLIVAAEAAATRAEEMGFDGQAAIEALPGILGIISLTTGQPMLSNLLNEITKAKGDKA